MGGHSSPAYADCRQNSQLTQKLINRLRVVSPTVDKVLERHGSNSISEYADSITPESTEPYQSRKELNQVVYDQVRPILGETIAQRTIADITRRPFVLTANHHGVDYFAQSVQATLISGSLNSSSGEGLATIPVFACGNIPLNNLTYPRGMLVYGLPNTPANMVPVKIPVFPDRVKRKMVNRAEGFDLSMIERTLQRIHKMTQKGDLTAQVSDTILELLTDDYSSTDVLDLAKYSDQAVLLNNRLWHRMFTSADIPELVYLELEKIVVELLISDLRDKNSLFSLLLFEPQLLQKLLFNLDGVRVCWRRDNLTRRMLDGGPRKINANNCGTCFFWGIDDQGMRVPLLCISEDTGQKKLIGRDDKGNPYAMTLNSDSLVEALKNEKILPSLFTCYTVLSLARGIACAGGYYQSEYLPQVQQGVANALEVQSDYREVIDKVLAVPTQIYLSGMQTVMCHGQNDILIPAGPIETIAAGGLSPSDMETIKMLSVREAHVASLFETLGDLSLESGWANDQKHEVAVECSQLLKDSIVIK